MKIPKKFGKRSEIVKAYNEAAVQASPYYGVLVEVYGDYTDDRQSDIDSLERIYFSVMNREYEGLKDLKRALRLKAFM